MDKNKPGFTSMSAKMCGICERQHKTVSADVWCPECEEFLCETCKEHHILAKLSENHQTVNMSDVQNLPSLVMEIKTNCAEHNHKLEFFCPKHEVPFCTLCTPQHQDCGEMTVIRHMPHIKSSSMMTDIQQNLKDLHDGIEAIYNDRQTNLSLLTEQEDKCRSQIKQIRQNINRNLDQLERTILEELGAIYVKQKSYIENFVQELDLHRAKLTKLQEDIVKINKHASDIQTFLSALKIQNILHKEDDYMRSARADKRISRVEISLTECYKGDVLPKFGKFDIVTKPSDIAIRKEKDKQAQILVPLARQKISLQKTLDLDLSNLISNAIITGCTTAEDGRILLADQQNDRIIVLSPDCLFICQNIALKSKPNDIVHSKGIAFVSSFSGRSVIRVDLKRNKITKRNQVYTGM